MKKFSLAVLVAFPALFCLAEGPKTQLVSKAWSDDFTSSKLSDRWMISSGGLGFAPDHVDLAHRALGLRLEQTRDAKGEFRSVGAEIQSRNLYGFGTYTWIMRASSTAITPTGIGESRSGSSSGVFSFVDDSAVEIDFEVEGNRQGVVWMCNWHKPKWTVAGARVSADTEFHEYKYVWAPSQIEWFIDGKSVQVVKDYVPQKPAYVIMNHWGTKTDKWGGTPSEGTRIMWVKRFSFAPL
jgi:hypothetical protein